MYIKEAIVDPEFPDGGGAPAPRVGEPTYYLAKFPPKTAGKWKKLNPEGIAHPWRPT